MVRRAQHAKVVTSLMATARVKLLPLVVAAAEKVAVAAILVVPAFIAMEKTAALLARTTARSVPMAALALSVLRDMNSAAAPVSI